jgi:hypothetical protein
MIVRKALISISILTALLLLLFAGYAGWNAARPEKTCASCHEIIPSLEIWQQSAHREVTCSECHGTALGNGFHSLKERAGMVFKHVRDEEKNIQPGLDEKGVLDVMAACVKCHRDE